jgi:hypothetical protein
MSIIYNLSMLFCNIYSILLYFFTRKTENSKKASILKVFIKHTNRNWK